MVVGFVLIGAICGYAAFALALWLGAPLWVAALLLLGLPSLMVPVLLWVRQQATSPQRPAASPQPGSPLRR